ncbi:MAG TPA: hypothetical protein VLV78_14160 [Thermoanaerobaculia bacterium]|nr:hypothetical protein [Thermoanaerobaculia bacterium]
MRASRVALVLASFLLAVSASAVNITGPWSGNVQGSQRCANSPGSVSFSGTATAGFSQTGDSFSGGIVATIPFPDGDHCSLGPLVQVAIAIQGTISGNTMTGTAFTPFGDKPFQGTADDQTISGSASDQGASLSFVLVRVGAPPPASDLSGTYTGQYNEVDDVSEDCKDTSTFTFSGSMTMQLAQSGSSLAGTFTRTGVKHLASSHGTCTVVDEDDGVHPISATVNGNVITGTVADADGKLTSLAAAVSGTTIAGTVDDVHDHMAFSVTKGGSGPTAPAVVSFGASPAAIQTGQVSMLAWVTSNATSVTIDNGVGSQPAIGSTVVQPSATTTYTLTASNSSGSATAAATVTVSGVATASIVVSSFPKGMVQAANQATAVDSFSLTNIGSAAGSVTLSANGSFFTLSDSSFPLSAGASRTVTVRALPQSAGTFDGTVSIAGNGAAAGTAVAIRLLSAAPPAGPVTAKPSTTRVEALAPAGQNPTGSVSFTNSSDFALQGIVVSDAPWIVPQTTTVNIPARQSATINFSIDRAKRPDADTLLGAAEGKLSLVFLSGSGSSAHYTISDATPTSTTISITLVDVVRPDVTAGSPTPLAQGELAIFASGLLYRSGLISDLRLANRNTKRVNDVKLYAARSAGPFSQLFSMPGLNGNAAVSLPGVAKNVFGVEGDSTSIQLRTADAAKFALGAMHLTSTAGNSFISFIPLMRSDRSIAAGERMFLPGVEKTATTKTDLYIQEVTGAAATIQTESLADDGHVVATRSDSLSPFGFLQIADAVAAGATAIRITNASPAAAKISAYATVADSATGDLWTVVDPQKAFGTTSQTTIVPVPPSAKGSKYDLFVTNTGSGDAFVSLETVASGGRRRLVKRAAAIGNAASTVTIPSQQTRHMSIDGLANGYVKVTGSPISAAARLSVSGNGGTFGSALPAVPSSAAIGVGDVRYFTGIDDASAATISAATPVTFRNGLALIETTGRSVTVRITLQFTFSASSILSASTAYRREFTLGGSQDLYLSDLVGSVVGTGRDSFGDLRNIQMDVEVASGGGRVLPVLVSTENSSGDTAVRVE